MEWEFGVEKGFFGFRWVYMGLGGIGHPKCVSLKDRLRKIYALKNQESHSIGE